jgi:hypothetical protein
MKKKNTRPPQDLFSNELVRLGADLSRITRAGVEQYQDGVVNYLDYWLRPEQASHLWTVTFKDQADQANRHRAASKIRSLGDKLSRQTKKQTAIQRSQQRHHKLTSGTLRQHNLPRAFCIETDRQNRFHGHSVTWGHPDTLQLDWTLSHTPWIHSYDIKEVNHSIWRNNPKRSPLRYLSKYIDWDYGLQGRQVYVYARLPKAAYDNKPIY